jgi:hypothetical protein
MLYNQYGQQQGLLGKRTSKFTQKNGATVRAESPDPECFLELGQMRKSAKRFYRSVDVGST